MKAVVLKPHDVVVCLELMSLPDKWEPTFAQFGSALNMSASEVHAAVKRAIAARLVRIESKSESTVRDGRKKPFTNQVIVNEKALLEFLIHGVRYAFPTVRGPITRGLPTSYAAPPLNQVIVASDDLPPVWPDSEGESLGYQLDPLIRDAAAVARRNPRLYELLALVDAIRDGSVRERKLAEKELKNRLRA